MHSRQHLLGAKIENAHLFHFNKKSKTKKNALLCVTFLFLLKETSESFINVSPISTLTGLTSTNSNILMRLTPISFSLISFPHPKFFLVLDHIGERIIIIQNNFYFPRIFKLCKMRATLVYCQVLGKLGPR